MNPLLSTLGAVRIIVIPAIGGEWRQFRFPRSKRVRIRKKWARDFRNRRWVEDGVAAYTMADGTIIASPRAAEMLRKQIGAAP